MTESVSTELLRATDEEHERGAPHGVPVFAFGFGALLARAHARTSDAAVIAGYCDNSAVLDGTLADWAEAYGEQTLKDHAALARAIKSGHVNALHGL